jgi:hypothetical protein
LGPIQYIGSIKCGMAMVAVLNVAAERLRRSYVAAQRLRYS